MSLSGLSRRGGSKLIENQHIGMWTHVQQYQAIKCYHWEDTVLPGSQKATVKDDVEANECKMIEKFG